MIPPSFHWKKPYLPEGIMVASDLTQEWILPWWWERYRRKNTKPICFIDLGMSLKMKKWSEERGLLIPLRILDDFVASQEEIPPALQQTWEEDFGSHFWESRSSWFKKPFALLQSPFQKTIWTDLDCEVRSSLDELFLLPTESSIAIALDTCVPNKDLPYPIYNSGVIVYQHRAPLIEAWAKACLETNQNFRGDQEVLSHLIFEQTIPLVHLQEEFNWSRMREEKEEVHIYHLHGVHGKTLIRKELIPFIRNNV